MASETSEETIRRIVSEYEFGKKLRHLRLKKKLSLVELGRRVDLSASMLSQLETGQLIPTLSTLARIGEVFGVDICHFFSKNSSKVFTVTRAQERMRFPEPARNRSPAYYFEVLAFRATEKAFSPYLAEFPQSSRDGIDFHEHEGSELLYMIEGSLLLIVDGQEHVLRKGDSIFFDASAIHSYRGLSNTAAKAIVVTFCTPP